MFWSIWKGTMQKGLTLAMLMLATEAIVIPVMQFAANLAE